MKKSKIMNCKYPNCNKEVPSDKSLFCMEHSRKLKEYRTNVGAALVGLALLGMGRITKKKK